MPLPLACSILPILLMSLTSTLIEPNTSTLGASDLAIQSEQSAPANSVNLDRRYREGETLRYEMKAKNRGWEYQIQADAVVKKDSEGVFYEEINWSHLHSNTAITVSPSKQVSTQTLSLAETSKYLKIPNLSTVQAGLVGPMTDMLAFYSDVFLAKQLKLSHAGQHATLEHGTPNSWADGKRVLIGEDSIDFDLTFVSTDPDKHTAIILVRHVPPAHPQVKLQADWMKADVGNAPNNWVVVEKTSDGGFMAQVGQETFDVHLKLDTRDGKILSADLHNTVVSVRRNCADRALLKCDAARPESIVRDVSLTLVPDSNVP